MNKQEIKDELKRHREKVEELERKLEEPERRDPEQGDVYWDSYLQQFVIASDENTYLDQDGDVWLNMSDAIEGDPENFTYLGKSKDVLCIKDKLIDEIIDALSVEDEDGDNFMGFLAGGPITFEDIRMETLHRLTAISPKFAEGVE